MRLDIRISAYQCNIIMEKMNLSSWVVSQDSRYSIGPRELCSWEICMPLVTSSHFERFWGSETCHVPCRQWKILLSMTWLPLLTERPRQDWTDRSSETSDAKLQWLSVPECPNTDHVSSIKSDMGSWDPDSKRALDNVSSHSWALGCPLALAASKHRKHMKTHGRARDESLKSIGR